MLKHYSVSIPNSPRHSQKPEFLYVAGQWQCCHNQSLMGELKRPDVGHPLKRVRITLGLRQDHWIIQEGGLSHCLFLLPDVKRLFFSRVKKKLHLCMRTWYLSGRSILIFPKSEGFIGQEEGRRAMTYPWVDSGSIGPSRLGIPSNYGKEAGSEMFTFRSLRLQDGPGPHQGLWFPLRLPEATPASNKCGVNRGGASFLCTPRVKPGPLAPSPGVLVVQWHC